MNLKELREIAERATEVTKITLNSHVGLQVQFREFDRTFGPQTALLMIDALERSRLYINSRKVLEDQKELDWDMFEGADAALEALTKHLEGK